MFTLWQIGRMEEWVPFLPIFSVLCGCEDDLSALFALTMFMGISGKAGLMGNLNVNVTHMEIENNVITINHDIVPPSYACPGCEFIGSVLGYG